MRPEQPQLIRRLIRAYASDSGTESLIGVVADTTGMLDACRELFDSNGRIAPHRREWLNRSCSEKNVSPADFADSVYQVLALFTNQHVSDDYYAILGLSSGATEKEIKAAYRKLSLQFHPDRAKQNQAYTPQRFIEISRAYHKLTQPHTHDTGEGRNSKNSVWQKTRKKGVSSRRRRQLAYWGAGAVTLLIVLSIVGSLSVRKRAMLAGLTEDRGAFIPPAQEIQPDPVIPAAMPASPVVVSSPVIALNEETTVPEAANPLEPVKSEADRPTPPHKFTTAEVHEEVGTEEEQGSTAPLHLSSHEEPAGQEEAAPQLTPQDEGREKPLKEPAEDGREQVQPTESRKQQPVQQRIVAQDEPAENEAAHSREPEPRDEQPVTQPETQPEPPDEPSPAAPTAVAGAAPSPPAEPDLQTRVDTFIKNYTTCYGQRDFDCFVTNFTPDAEENGKTFTQRESVYRELFGALNKCELRIDILKSAQVDNTIETEGRFHVTLGYKNGKRLNGAGPIAFILTEEAGEPKIKKMTYTFDKK